MSGKVVELDPHSSSDIVFGSAGIPGGRAGRLSPHCRAAPFSIAQKAPADRLAVQPAQQRLGCRRVHCQAVPVDQFLADLKDIPDHRLYVRSEIASPFGYV